MLAGTAEANALTKAKGRSNNKYKHKCLSGSLKHVD